jgi:hypothetical protein
MPKIYLGHPKDGESESSELRALGLRFNKAEPSRIGLIGLRQLEQPGYESYVHHIAGFMYATDTRERQSLHKVGFPIQLPISKCFPILQPPLHIKVKQPDGRRTDEILQQLDIEYQKGSQKTGRDEFSIFTINDYISSLGPLRALNTISSHPPSGQLSFDGVLACLLTRRIFSSFFRTHVYPAYSAPTELEDYLGSKRRIDEEEDSHPSKRRKEQEKGEGAALNADGTEMNIDEEQAKDKVVLRFAKPSDNTVSPWGLNLGDTPQIHGITFPFIHQLSNWDKDMVPIVMEHYFIRCFGSDDTQISTAFSKFVEKWRSEVYCTLPGLAMSHMAKVISIALPAQARPFPIFENDQYRGCYLAGANFSVAIKATLTRPTPMSQTEMTLPKCSGNIGSLRGFWIR